MTVQCLSGFISQSDFGSGSGCLDYTDLGGDINYVQM